jgi:hypothetical protein
MSSATSSPSVPPFFRLLPRTAALC